MDISKLLRQLAEQHGGGTDDAEASDQLQIPPGILELLGALPGNTARPSKIMNDPDEQINKILHDSGDVGARYESVTSGNVGPKSNAFLKEKARALASRSKFYEATTLLEEVEANEEITDIGTKLMMAECYLQLGRGNRANKCVKFVEKTLTSPPFPDAYDLLALAKELLAVSSYVRALLLLKIAVNILLNNGGNPDEILRGIYKCYSKVDDIVKIMVKQGDRNRTIAADLGIETMLEMYESILGIENCSRDQQVLKQAWCCRYLDHDYHLIGDHKKSIQYGLRGVKAMEDHFTPAGAMRYRIYGCLMHNLGVTLCNTQRFDEALSMHQKSLEAKENALDYENDLLKKHDVDETKKGIRTVRMAMGNA